MPISEAASTAPPRVKSSAFENVNRFYAEIMCLEMPVHAMYSCGAGALHTQRQCFGIAYFSASLQGGIVSRSMCASVRKSMLILLGADLSRVVGRSLCCPFLASSFVAATGPLTICSLHKRSFVYENLKM